MSRLRTLGQGILTTLVGFLMAFLLMEGFLRFIYDPLQPQPGVNAPPNWEPSSSLYMPDSIVDYRLRPQMTAEFVRQSDGAVITVKTNNIGFRDERDYEQGAGGVLLLGDSLVFGAGVEFESTIGEQLEPLLGEEVMGWGVPGYGQDQERGLLDVLDAPAYRPDMILVLITTSNDFGQTLDLGTLEEVAGQPAPQTHEGQAQVDQADAPSLIERIKRPLRNLRTYRLLAVYANRTLGMMGRRNVEMAEEAQASTRADLEKLMAYGEQHDVRVAFVLIPPRAFARPLEETYAYERKVYTFYGDTLSALGAEWLDLEPSLINESALDDPAAIYWDDVHLSAEGNRLTAVALAEFIARLR